MSQPQTRPAASIPASKILIAVAFACMLIAALTAAGVVFIGPALAWAFGALAAWLLSMIV